MEQLLQHVGIDGPVREQDSRRPAKGRPVNGSIERNAPATAVLAEIEFLRPTPDRAFVYGYEPAGHEPPPTAVFDSHRVVILDARTAPRRVSLHEHGATLVEHQSSVRDLHDSAQLTGVCYPEAAAVIKSATGASRVVVFDHNIRRGFGMGLRPDRYDQGRPVLHAHTDYTEVSAVRRLRDHFGARADRLLRHRFMQVNLWRPIRAPLRDAPLAICDASSISRRRLAAVDLRYPGRRGEIYYLTHDPAQRWFYAPDMRTDEAWVFKNYDSDTDCARRFAAHSAFEDPAARAHVPPRESIEVRAFALFDA